MTCIVTFCHIVEPNISSHEEAMQTACVRVSHCVEKESGQHPPDN